MSETTEARHGAGGAGGWVVHLLDADGRPACGSRMGTVYLVSLSVNCKRCRRTRADQDAADHAVALRRYMGRRASKS